MKSLFSYKMIVVFYLLSSPSFILVARERFESDIITCNLEYTFFSDEPEKFAIVRFNVSETNDMVKVDIREIKIIDGHIKEIPEAEIASNKGTLLCQVMNDQQTVLKEIALNNPTRLRLEYPNTDNSIGSQVVNIPEREVMIRFTYTSEMKFLVISRFGDNGKQEVIKTIPFIEK